MVSAPHVDHPVEAPDDELVAVVGKVTGQIGEVTVRLHQHTITPVAVLRAPEPDGAVLVVDQPTVAE